MPASLDNYVWQLTYKWATHTRPTKPKKWIAGATSAGSTSSETTDWEGRW
jgi:hypothetical protein